MKSIHKKYLKIVGYIWAGFFVVFLAAYFLIMAPQLNTKKLLKKKNTEVKQVYMDAKNAELPKTKKILINQIDELSYKLGNFVSNVEDSANVTFDISQIANDKNVTSFGIKDEQEAKEIPKCKIISENGINVSYSAGFPQFAAFLNALERNRPVVFVDSFMISKQNNQTDIKVDMDLTILVKKQEI